MHTTSPSIHPLLSTRALTAESREPARLTLSPTTADVFLRHDLSSTLGTAASLTAAAGPDPSTLPERLPESPSTLTSPPPNTLFPDSTTRRSTPPSSSRVCPQQKQLRSDFLVSHWWFRARVVQWLQEHAPERRVGSTRAAAAAVGGGYFIYKDYKLARNSTALQAPSSCPLPPPSLRSWIEYGYLGQVCGRGQGDGPRGIQGSGDLGQS